MGKTNKTSFSHVLDAIVPMMETFGVAMFAARTSAFITSFQ